MAVAQAQHVLEELMAFLEENDCEVKFAMHPVAGRMPGHMNVLLAEADVPYEKLVEIDDINQQMPSIDISLIIGANDIVNPAANTDKGSPIYGMPIINVQESGTVIVFKRSMASGFSGLDNILFYGENTRMLFGDAKESLIDLVSKFKT
jgi:NAD(P) transhydrogenase subunit beta